MVFLLSLAALGDTCTWGEPVEVAAIGGVAPESSGLVASRARPGWWLTHDDKGGAPELYAFTPDGTVGRSHLVAGAEFDDWEDIAAGPCPEDGSDCLYIGDIGDNDGQRDTLTVYVAREPASDGAVAEVVATWSYAWPDAPRDAETLLVHPCTGQIFIVSRESSGARVALAPPGGGTLEVVATLDLGASVTGGDFDTDGDRLALRGTGGAWEWAVDPGEPTAAFSTEPIDLPLERLEDSESIAYGLEGDLWTTAEGLPMVLQQLPCVSRTLSDHACSPPTDPVERGEEKGCGCTSSSPITVWMLLPLLGLARRRGRARPQ